MEFWTCRRRDRFGVSSGGNESGRREKDVRGTGYDNHFISEDCGGLLCPSVNHTLAHLLVLFLANPQLSTRSSIHARR
jgi:hypothetical protein